jgi:putative flippase GtrA
VGVAGFFVDWACLTLFLWLGAGFVLGRALSYLCAATVTWALNRFWTFASTDPLLLRQAVRFISANALGGAVNYGVSVMLAVTLPAVFAAHPGLAVAAGSLTGLAVNFFLSERFVFATQRRLLQRRRPARQIDGTDSCST